jgi:hypothetical protein
MEMISEREKLVIANKIRIAKIHLQDAIDKKRMKKSGVSTENEDYIINLCNERLKEYEQSNNIC